jgi:REP element-mobilizing transposase RayT
MARLPRLHVPGGLYHVLARGNNRQRLFRQSADYRFYIMRLARLLPRTETRCYAYCLMPNHLHLLLEPGPKPLSRTMQPLQLAYSLYFNRHYRHTGHVFQGRYMALLCQRDAYLLELVRYLHLNPVRAGLAKRPDGWSWSSHRAYLGGVSSVIPLHVEPVLGQFGKDPRRARSAFQGFVREGMALGHRRDLYEAIEARVLGTEAFAEEVLQPRRSGAETPVRVTIDRILETAAEAWDLDPLVLRAPARLRRAAQARAAAAYLAREIAGQPLTAVARAVRRDVASLSFGLRRLDDAMVGDADLSQRLAAAASALRSGAHPHFRRRRT